MINDGSEPAPRKSDRCDAWTYLPSYYVPDIGKGNVFERHLFHV